MHSLCVRGREKYVVSLESKMNNQKDQNGITTARSGKSCVNVLACLFFNCSADVSIAAQPQPVNVFVFRLYRTLLSYASPNNLWIGWP